MVIRTQDKENLINFNNVSQIYIIDNTITVDFNNILDAENGGCEDIATYSTEEEAVTQLDNLYQFICRMDLGYQMEVEQ